MEAKGVALLARKKLVSEQFGEDTWDAFLKEYGEKDGYFRTDILPTALIPIDKFLAFNEALLKKFFLGDERAYITMGERTAEYSLVEGPYKTYLRDRDYRKLAEESVPKLWKKFYTDGTLEIIYQPGQVEAAIHGLPQRHVYFESAVVGYMKRTLELAGARDVSYRKLAGDDIRFRFTFTE
jgi:hypothetical protein